MVSCSTGPAVYGQVFENTMENINVPGIGPVTARVGVSPGPLVQCEVRSRFSAGQKLTTPLVAYLIVDRTSKRAVQYAIEFLFIVPHGPYTTEQRTSRFNEGVLRACHTQPFDKGPPPFQLHWRLNDAVGGHISFDKE
jgi:hypothetical protein